MKLHCTLHTTIIIVIHTLHREIQTELELTFDFFFFGGWWSEEFGGFHKKISFKQALNVKNYCMELVVIY